jgi:calcium-dependent protein kinase
MGNDHQHKKDKKNKNKKNKIDEDEFNKEDNNDKKDNIGEEFILEEWEVYNDKNKNIDNSVKFDKDLLISEANKDPYEEYKEIKMLGEGSYGQVFLVNHKVIGATRAMKIIQKVEDVDENNVLEILNEINVLKKIDHPNIIKIFECYMQKGNYYLVTEYCSGGELFELVNNTKFTEVQVAYLMYQLFSSINYCHKMKIIHRDLKPENILITKNENNFIDIKVCDFGTSQIFKKGDIQKETIGSLYYVAPEVINKNYNFKCDLWSCGIIMYILLTNKLPFGGSSDEEIITNILSGLYNETRLKNCSPETKELISLLLEKDINIRINAETALNHKFFQKYKVKEMFNEIKDQNKIDKFVNNLKNYKRKSILQETTIAYLVHNFPDMEQINDACKLFNKIDLNDNGQITLNDFHIGLSLVLENRNIYLKDDEFVEIFANLDANNDNYLGYEDFVRGVIDKNELLNDKILEYAFKHFDKSNNGYITIKEIGNLYRGHIMIGDINEGLKKIIEEVGKDENGKITFDDFKRLMTNIVI